MNIKQMIDSLLVKTWTWEDIMWLVFSIVIASIFTTPLFGVPIGLAVYFLLFYKNKDE